MIKPNRSQVSRTASIQSPTGGLNAKDPIANMKETEAVTMENWFPTPASVDTRNGYLRYATGMTGLVDTLMTYNNGFTQQMFAIVGGSIYDVTNEGAVGSPLVTGLSNSRFQYAAMGTAGGYFLLAVNGLNDMQYYNGSSWSVINGVSTPAITGVATSDIISVNIFKNRVFMIEKESMNAWYLPVASIGGAAQSLDLSGIFKLGGYLMLMANWTIDNAAGIDDYAAFITSEGEVALYKGIDPSSASDWALVGTFRMGRPIGRRAAIKAGSDVLVLTSDGAFPLSKALLTDRSQMNLAATDKISNLINADIKQYANNFGWQPILYPTGNKLIINVPRVESNESIQYVMNTTHGAWTVFRGWNAFCFETLNDKLFFGGDGVVYQADVGQSDDGANINAVCQQAFSYFGTKQTKKFQMVRPIFVSEGEINPAIVMNTDFSQDRTTVSPTFSGSAGTEWDEGDWDTFDWAGGDNITKRWQSVSGVGFSGGLRVVTQTKDISCRWQSTDIVFEVGGVL